MNRKGFISPGDVDRLIAQTLFALEESKLRIETKAPQSGNVVARPGQSSPLSLVQDHRGFALIGRYHDIATLLSHANCECSQGKLSIWEEIRLENRTAVALQ